MKKQTWLLRRIKIITHSHNTHPQTRRPKPSLFLQKRGMHIVTSMAKASLNPNYISFLNFKDEVHFTFDNNGEIRQ